MRSWGTTAMTSRLMATKVGRIMMPRTIDAKSRDVPNSWPELPKSSFAKGQRFSQGLTVTSIHGATTSRPQSP